MTKPTVFITRIIPNPGLILLNEHFPPEGIAQSALEIWPHELPPTRTQLIEHARGADGLLCLLTDKIDGDLMDAIGPQLKIISNFAVGVDNIDLSAATARGIPVGNTPGVLTCLLYTSRCV